MFIKEMEKKARVKALGLCSGGLDSILSALLLREQNIEVNWISFETPFFDSDKARKAAGMTGIPIITRDITTVYVELLKNPACRFGKNMNPCMDCHTLMFRLAGEIMREEGFDFLFSGEVLGQRPMSQTLSSLNYVEKHSGFAGYILRPLSARRLAETMPEKNGWVDREQLLDLSGRSRKPQIELARRYGVTTYPAPAGGCLLTDKGYSLRLKDLMAHAPELQKKDLHLLKYGRHLRLSPQAKLIVGRNQKDNEQLQTHWNSDQGLLLKLQNTPGPTAILSSSADRGTMLLAASICAGYGKASVDQPVQVRISGRDGQEEVTVLPLPHTLSQKYLIKG